MMENIKLAGSDEDLYSGYNDVHPALDSRYDENFRKAVIKSSYGKKTGTSHGRRSAAGYRRSVGSSAGRTSFVAGPGTGYGIPPQTAGGGAGGAGARPMTAVRGVGYQSRTGVIGSSGAATPSDVFKSASPFHLTKDDPASNTPEVRIRSLEKKCTDLLEESILIADRREFPLALDRAKEAVTREKGLARQREQFNSSSADHVVIPVNNDLHFSVLFNLALQYENNEMWAEAMNAYSAIIKTRSFSGNLMAGRLRVNIGNVYCRQNNYAKGIKFFRMALDQIPATYREMRMRIMGNIGLAFVRMSQYSEAITALEYIMSEKSDFRTALHLIVCYFALGDKEKMKKCFVKMVDIPREMTFEERYEAHHLDGGTDEEADPMQQLLLEAIRNDSLRKVEREKESETNWCLLTAAKLIAPVLGDSFSAGYGWCVDTLRGSAYSYLADDLEIHKAVKHLRKREFDEAIETLKSFERKEAKSASMAATNLAFLYLCQNEIPTADKYADEAVRADRYNSGALVNKGNCAFKTGDYERAREYYKEALSNDSACVEAIYNLGLASKRLAHYEEALDFFLKMQALVHNQHVCLFQIAQVYEFLNEKDHAIDWYNRLLTFVPSDPNLLNKLCDMAEADHDRQQAMIHLNDSYRSFPSHIPTLERLAAHYIEAQLYERAVKYLEQASNVQPYQVKWLLMIAACYRRAGNYQQALAVYMEAHRRFPDNTECLKYLTRLCTDLGLESEASDYADELKRLEKMRDRATSSMSVASRRNMSRSGVRRSGGGGANGSREGSASSSGSSGYLTAASPRSISSKASQRNGEILNGGGKSSVLDDMTTSMTPVYDADLGSLPERPTTSWKRRSDEDEFGNEEIDLPE